MKQRVKQSQFIRMLRVFLAKQINKDRPQNMEKQQSQTDACISTICTQTRKLGQKSVKSANQN